MLEYALAFFSSSRCAVQFHSGTVGVAGKPQAQAREPLQTQAGEPFRRRRGNHLRRSLGHLGSLGCLVLRNIGLNLHLPVRWARLPELAA